MNVKGHSSGVSGLTITFNHEGFHNVVSDHFEVGMPNPVADGGLEARVKVVQNGDFMA